MPRKEDNIIKNYLDKIKVIERHNKSYYDKDSPSISDQKYDKLKQAVLELEKKFLFLKEYGSIKDKVGFTPSSKFNKIKFFFRT